MNHVPWIGTFVELGYTSDEDKEALKDSLAYVLESVKSGITNKYIRQEFIKRVEEKFRLNFIEKVVIKKMIKAQLENDKNLTELQINSAIKALSKSDEED